MESDKIGLEEDSGSIHIDQILAGGFKYWFRRLQYYFPLYFAIAMAIAGITALLVLVAGFNPWILHLARVFLPSLINIAPLILPPIDLLTIGYLVGFALLFIFHLFLQMLLAATVIKQTADLHAGFHQPLSNSFQHAWRHKRSIFGAYLVANLVPPLLLLGGILLPLFLPLLLGFWVMTSAQLFFWFAVVILSTLITLVATLLIIIRLAVYLPIAVLEARGSVESLQKSWQIIKGNEWRTLALLLLVDLVVVFIVSITAGFSLWVWLMPMPPYYPILTAILDSLVISVMAPLPITVSTMLYHDLKSQK